MLGVVHLLLEYELDVLVVFDEPGVLRSECLACSGVGRVKRLRPVLPRPASAVPLVENLIQRAIQCKFMKEVPFPIAVVLKGACPIPVLPASVAKFTIQNFQEALLQPVHTAVGDILRGTKFLQLALHCTRTEELLGTPRRAKLGDSLGIDVDQVLVKN